MGEQPRRLDSWKEIAEYLGRDVRTAMRWAKSSGLPVRRVAGGKGRSVFAFAHEIDAWLSGHAAAEPRSKPITPLRSSSPPPPANPASSTQPAASHFALTMALTVLGLALTAGAVVGLRGMKVGAAEPARALATSDAIRIVDTDGGERAVYRFSQAGKAVMARTQSAIVDTDGDGRAEIMAGISYYDDAERGRTSGGELLNLTPQGNVRWRFAFDDRIAFADAEFNGPWGLTDWQINAWSAPSRVAVAAHDTVWWPSVVAILDHEARRSHTFVNPGWVESLLWLDADRLAIGGFNNARDEAIAAIIDTSAAATAIAQAPGTAGTPFACLSCGSSSTPLFYASFPRSELNRVTASRFNRAQVSRVGDRVLVTTIEVAGEQISATAIYEFDRQLRLQRARFDDAYWDRHRALELAGQLTHTRADCPERNGPVAIHLWAGHEWQREVPPR